jgi:hypothetical protein
MLSEGLTLAIITSACFAISEMLPFISKTPGNGVLHTLLLICLKTDKTITDNEESEQ